ncbi:S41 family peptidase [Nocardiopsis valliformis]|uniref:S41 family peptidase n=1 Tax=Nocardiopsis valliformis TaxID=239974 RepID=UPI00034DF92B|nr:S41 family peptidase [Nocardiopsis valliformis]
MKTLNEGETPDSVRAESPVNPRKKLWRRVLAAIAIVVLLLGGGGVWLVHTYGPQFGVYLFPPSPQRYADVALELMERGYYADGAEWEAAREGVLEAAEGADSYADLHGVLAEAADAAGGSHTFFLTPGEAADRVGESTSEFRAPTVTVDGGVATVVVPELGSVSGELQQRYADEAAADIAAAAPEVCGWIIDLRENTGGNMYPMLSGLSSLLPNGAAMQFRMAAGTEMGVTVQDDGVGMNGNSVISVEETPKITDQPIALLQSERTASSGEAVLTVFRGLDSVESFGEDSAGYTSGNSVHTLYDGAELVLTSGVYVDRDGVNLNEEPIRPDHSTDAADEDARAWLADADCG